VKNPLSLVRANIDLLELTDSRDQHKKNYRIMRREIERINDLMLDFIQFAKPVSSETARFGIIPVISELLDTVKATYDQNITFILNCAAVDMDLAIPGDINKIRRVLLNIIKNSVEAVGQGGLIEITVKSANGFAEIVCRDNGKGLTPEEIEKMNTPFFTTKQGGSGLGLFLSRAIIKEHNGSFDISGAAGAGCVVTIKLPKAQ
jgi:two-component system sporulation sensor kinase B